jgi:hypothetical protein
MPIPEKNVSKRGDRRARLRSARTWRFEQLESRAMLSATMGPMLFGPGAHSFEMQAYGDFPSQAGMLAPQEFGMHMDAAPERTDWMSGPMPGGRHDDRMMFGEFGPGPATWGYGSSVPEKSALKSGSEQSASAAAAATPNLNENYYTDTVFIVTVTQLGYHNPISTSPQRSAEQQHADTSQGGPLVSSYKELPGEHEYEPITKIMVPVTGGSVSQNVGAIAAPVLTQSTSREVALSSLTPSSA